MVLHELQCAVFISGIKTDSAAIHQWLCDRLRINTMWSIRVCVPFSHLIISRCAYSVVFELCDHLQKFSNKGWNFVAPTFFSLVLLWNVLTRLEKLKDSSNNVGWTTSTHSFIVSAKQFNWHILGGKCGEHAFQISLSLSHQMVRSWFKRGVHIYEYKSFPTNSVLIPQRRKVNFRKFKPRLISLE